jgi:predicted dehydrogenase
MKDIGFGIIGIGRQGLRLAEHIRKDIANGELIAVCRRSVEGHDYSKKHGIKFYSDYTDLLKDDEIDAVIITTPSGLHGTHALDALNAKKHVLIDKPISSTIKQGEQILAAAKKEKLTVAVNFPLRVNPVSQTLKINLKKIGRLRKIQVTVSHGPPRSAWQRDPKLSNGGVILDLGSHYLDLVSFLTGCHPEIISNAYSEEVENEHSGFIDLAYQDFNVSMVLLRNQKLKKNFITCAGENGFIYADFALKEVIISNDHAVNEIKCPPSYDFQIILDNLIKAINKKAEIIADAEDGLHSLKTVLAIYKGISTRRPVRLL